MKQFETNSPSHPRHLRVRPVQRLSAPLLWAGLLAGSVAQAQTAAAAPAASPGGPTQWQACQALKGDPAAQLSCFQQWADSQSRPATAPPVSASGPAAPGAGETSAQLLPALNEPSGRLLGCKDNNFSTLSQFWELQRGTDCDTFGLRGYKANSFSVVGSNSVNKQPTSPTPGHSALTPTDYRTGETKLQLSVRTKVAKGLFKNGDNPTDDHDSVWFAYTQQSYWQLFNEKESRPFRSTDHEPEMFYIYPHQIALGGGWNYRLSGAGIVHQSNGQYLPVSRSWNRVYLMSAAEKPLGPQSGLILQGRIWNRLSEGSGVDENPGIEDYVGRAELTGNWKINNSHALGLTVRHSLKKEARGSTRLDWLIAPTAAHNYTSLRYHVQLFSGYGDSLLDYNRRRNVLSVGLSLVDW